MVPRLSVKISAGEIRCQWDANFHNMCMIVIVGIGGNNLPLINRLILFSVCVGLGMS